MRAKAVVRFVHRPAPEEDEGTRKRRAEEGDAEKKIAKDDSGKQKRRKGAAFEIF